MTVLNDLDRFHLVMDTIDRLPQTGDKGIDLKQQLKDKLIEHKQYIDQTRPRLARSTELEMEQHQMNTQALMDTARGDGRGRQGPAGDGRKPSHLQQTLREAGHSADRRSPARLSGIAHHHARSWRIHQWRDSLRRDDSPAEERRHSFHQVITDAGIIPGIKVDTGAKDMAGHPGEKITEGLDGLRDRLKEYFQMGARFAKWRAVIAVGDGIPSRSGLEANAHALARYAALCQEAGLVPIVEPEVLMDGEHTLERCRKVTEEALRNVFIQLNCQRVMLEGIILKPNMVLPGLTCPQQASDEAVADATVQCLLRNVPAAVPGIAFLSGGQSAELASARLNAMNVRFKSRAPWALGVFVCAALFSNRLWKFGEAKRRNVKAAQQALLHRAKCNRAARRGEYTAAMETARV